MTADIATHWHGCWQVHEDCARGFGATVDTRRCPGRRADPETGWFRYCIRPEQHHGPCQDIHSETWTGR